MTNANVRIRAAEERDFEWVATLMTQALSPFYDGDHRAHAKRIFDTHIHGGIDIVGHFSSGQHMYIAELNGNNVGMIHLVEKRQGTLKISPLIVAPDSRGAYGVGSTLLDFAESFAIEKELRQIYCTVASANRSALNFFVNHGFYITGTANKHYNAQHDEHMLYKQVEIITGYDSPSISVLPFDCSKHADAVRELILTRMSSNFNGIDDAWVNALFEGAKRAPSADVNDKYKIIYVAESAGKVIGVAGATPKKGDPIKLMPVAAKTKEAFEALIIDLQGLLMGVGRKMYLHIVPEAWQVACLQRHGWILEGIFPGGYSEASIVQQWGFNLKGETVMRKLRIKRPYFEEIMSGNKNLEVRVGYSSIKKIKAGDTISLETGFRSCTVKVLAVRNYLDFESMLKVEDYRRIMPQSKSSEETLNTFRGIYDATKERFGVYVLEITPVK